MLNMHASLRRAAMLLAALLALSSTTVDGVATCAECPGDKTCLLEDKSLAMGAAQRSLQLKFCNFDVAKKDQYSVAFSLKKPLACDPNGTLVPKIASLTPQAGCAAANCVVTAALADPVDWAVLLKNDAEVSVLQAKLEGNDEVVQVAQGTADTGASAITSDGAATATVCSPSIGVKAARLSTLAACNKVTLCRGKPADTGCTTPVTTASSSVLVDKVTCSAESCAGTIALVDGLPCEMASSDGNALIVSITVGNSNGSGFASIGTIAAAPVATISAASGVSAGSTEVTIKSDATCAATSLNVTVDGLALKGFAPANGTILISLASALTDDQVGSNLDIAISQCGVESKAFSVAVGETGAESNAPAKAAQAMNKTSSSSSGDVGMVSPTGTQVTQEQNASTGLPYGLYIGIAVGVLALLGFWFECWYHRRRHRKEHGSGNGGDHHNNAV